MPNTYTPTPTTMPSGVVLTKLVDGDGVNANNLYKEVSPGADPNATICLAMDYIAGLAHPGAQTRTQGAVWYDQAQNVVIAPSIGYNITAGDLLVLPLDRIPHGATLTGVSVAYFGGTHSALPTIMPHYAIEFTNLSGVTTAIGSTVSDTSATTGVYDGQHAIASGALSQAIDLTQNVYYLNFTAEGGSNTANLAHIYGYTATFTL